MEMEFRPMRAADAPRIAELERLCFRTPWSENALRGELKNPLARYRVLVCEDCIVAYAGMWLYFGEAHITNVAVDPAWRRQGLGRAMMLDMMRTARKHRAKVMTLEVRESNLGAQQLYAKLGFEKAGERKRYYSDTGESAYILWNYDIAATIDSAAAQC